MNATGKLSKRTQLAGSASLGSRLRGAFARTPKLPARVRWIILAALVIAAASGFAYYKLVYVPAQSSATSTLAMQTSTVRTGDITISATGSGTLVSQDEVDLAFQGGGTVTEVDVKVGDQVQKGDLLAKIDDTDLQLAYTEAKRSYAELTSASAVVEAKAAVATASASLDEANQHLEYVISPAVYYWEHQIETRQAALDEAQAAGAASPSNTQVQAALAAAQESVKSAKASLAGAQYEYENNYVKNNFVFYITDQLTHRKVRYDAQPSEADILQARADVATAESTLQQAQWLYTALTGGEVPDDATGSSLTALEQAKLNLQDAQEALDNASLKATIPGTVMAVDITAGETTKSGTTAVTISDLSRPYLEVFLDESDWSNVKVGEQADITFDILPDQTFTGVVTQVDPGLYTQNGQTVVRAYIQLSDQDAAKPDLPLGTAASVEVIAARAENALLVSVDALHKTDDGTYTVFVLENGTPKLRVVEVGLQDLVNAQVTSGLEAGDIVTTGITATK